MIVPISLIIRRFAAILAIVVILAAFGGTWAGKGQTLPPGTLPRENVEYRVYIPFVEVGYE